MRYTSSKQFFKSHKDVIKFNKSIFKYREFLNRRFSNCNKRAPLWYRAGATLKRKMLWRKGRKHYSKIVVEFS